MTGIDQGALDREAVKDWKKFEDIFSGLIMTRGTLFLLIVAYLFCLEGLSWSTYSAGRVSGQCLVEEESHTIFNNENTQKDCSTFFAGMVSLSQRLVDLMKRDDNDKAIVSAFTIVLAVSTIGLWISTRKLWEAGEKQIAVAADATEAAKRSADALQAAERANVIERIDGAEGFDDLFLSGERYKNSPTMNEIEYPAAQISATLRFKNYGKTPAIILSYSIEPIISEQMPDLDFSTLVEINFQTMMLVNFVVEPLGATEDIPLTRFVRHSWAQSNLLAAGRLLVWFAGYVTFIDVFDIKRTRKFIWRYDRPMRRFVPDNSISAIERSERS